MTTYMYLSSTDSPVFCPDNTGSDFSSMLPMPLDVRNAEYELALCSIQGSLPSSYIVLCDVIDYSIINDQTMQILKQVTSKDDFLHLQYFRIMIPELRKIRISLVDLNLKPINVSDVVRCTLCLRKRATTM